MQLDCERFQLFVSTEQQEGKTFVIGADAPCIMQHGMAKMMWYILMLQ